MRPHNGNLRATSRGYDWCVRCLSPVRLGVDVAERKARCCRVSVSAKRIKHASVLPHSWWGTLFAVSIFVACKKGRFEVVAADGTVSFLAFFCWLTLIEANSQQEQIHSQRLTETSSLHPQKFTYAIRAPEIIRDRMISCPGKVLSNLHP